MPVKHYNTQYFTAKLSEGKELTFVCYTTYTRNGFCHTAHLMGWDYTASDTKASYLNRTWERFDYESVLKKAIEKLPTEIRQTVYDQLIDGKAAEVEEACNKQLEAFQKLHAGLSDENKEQLANSGIVMHSDSDVKGVMGLMALMTIMQ